MRFIRFPSVETHVCERMEPDQNRFVYSTGGIGKFASLPTIRLLESRNESGFRLRMSSMSVRTDKQAQEKDL